MLVQLLKNETDGTYYRDFTYIDVPISLCKYGVNFFYANVDEANLFGIETYLCPDWQNLTLQANWNSPQHA